MRAYTLTEKVTLVTEDCFRCGVVFAMPKEFREQRLRDKDTFYCPNGHGQCYTESEADRLKKQVARLRTEADQAWTAYTAASDQARAAARSNAALKGVVTKQRRRAAAGVCPCCNRSFQALARHMASKHPGYATAPAEAGEVSR